MNTVVVGLDADSLIEATKLFASFFKHSTGRNISVTIDGVEHTIEPRALNSKVRFTPSSTIIARSRILEANERISERVYQQMLNFIRDRCITGPTLKISNLALNTAFDAFCGETITGNRIFPNTMKRIMEIKYPIHGPEFSITKGRNNEGVIYYGIDLRENMPISNPPPTLRIIPPATTTNTTPIIPASSAIDVPTSTEIPPLIEVSSPSPTSILPLMSVSGPTTPPVSSPTTPSVFSPMMSPVFSPTSPAPIPTTPSVFSPMMSPAPSPITPPVSSPTTPSAPSPTTPSVFSPMMSPVFNPTSPGPIPTTLPVFSSTTPSTSTSTMPSDPKPLPTTNVSLNVIPKPIPPPAIQIPSNSVLPLPTHASTSDRHPPRCPSLIPPKHGRPR